METPGAQALTDGTAILGDDSEPQPDASLRVLVGGQTRAVDDYVIGCPELVCEVASSTASYDLHEKLAAHDRYGAKEYVAVLVRTAAVRWFRRGADGRLAGAPPDADGVYRSATFPGLWLDGAALLAGGARRVLWTCWRPGWRRRSTRRSPPRWSARRRDRRDHRAICRPDS